MFPQVEVLNLSFELINGGPILLVCVLGICCVTFLLFLVALAWSLCESWFFPHASSFFCNFPSIFSFSMILHRFLSASSLSYHFPQF